MPSDQQSTTVAEGAGIPFQGVSIQAGEKSFTSGNQTTNPQSPISNVLWGSAAAAMLGATLAEWQRKREEEAALMALYAPSGGDGGSDDDEMPEDVRARRRGKVIAKNQVIRAQEQAWENARVAQLTQQTQNAIAKNKNLTAAETEMGKVNPVTPYVPAGNIDRDEEKWLAGKESQRAWANVQAQEQAKEEQKSGNWLSNLWNAGMSAMGSILSPGGGGGLLSVRRGDPNPFTEWWNNTVVPAWDNVVAWWNEPWWWEKPAPTSTPVAPLWSTPVEWGWTATPTLTQTITPTPTNTPTPTLISLTPSFYDYGTETIGFDDNGRQVVLNAANLTANKLLTVSPDLRYPHLAFAFIHGGKIQIILDPDYPVGDNDENCVAEVNKITCNTLPTEANLIHELGHIFWRNQVSKGVIMIDTVNPIRMSDGTYLDYDTEGNYWFRQPDGFLRGEDSWEHKPNGDTTSGDAKVEHSADMFLNFIYDGTGNKIYGFSLDQYGDARREEMLKILYQVFGK